MTKYASIVAGVVDSISFEENSGWTEVPDDVFPGHTDNGDGTFSAPAADAIAADQVKEEASWLILSIAPDWKQRNYIARGAELIRKVQLGGTLTPEEEAEETAMQALWDMVKAIRAKSDELEAMSPIPADYAAQLEAVAST